MKRLAALYPRRWRERYGAEIDAFLERRRVTPAAVVDLLRGLVDAHRDPELARDLVFVPEIGFRPRGTRTLLEPARTHHDDTTITVRSVAAGPERTELVIEWESHADANIVCAPAALAGSIRPKGLVIASATPGGADEVVFAKLRVAGGEAMEALSFGPRAFMTRHGWSTHTLTFPPLPAGTDQAELVLGVDRKEWRVAVALRRTHIGATPVAVESRHSGMIVRATAVCRSGDEVMVGLELQGEDARTLIGMVGPEPPPLTPPMLKPPRNWEPAADGIVLTDDRGNRASERRRLRHVDAPPTHLGGSQPPRRMTCVFGPVHPDATTAVVSVPWIEVSELGGSVEVDLTSVPVTAELSGHRFEVVRAEPSVLGTERTKIVVRSLDTDAARTFVRPLSVRARVPTAGGFSYSWGKEPDGSRWMDTGVADPPVVAFSGAALEVRGPWELRIPLD
jgi:hypothetical protein